MDKPKDIFGIDWDLWSSTYLFPLSCKFKFNYPQLDCVQRTSEVDKVYPGFTAAFVKLESLGYSRSFITSALKFCILHADGVELAAFLVKPEIRSTFETALAIGLCGEELSKLLSNTSGYPCATNQALELPGDMGFVANAYPPP